MKNVSLLLLAVIAMTFVACQKEIKSVADLKTQKDSLSYGLGVNIGKGLAKDSIDVDPALVARAIKDAMENKALLNDSAVQKTFETYGQQRFAKLSEKNKKDGEAFLAANKQKEGVVTLPSGLQYRVLVKGTGRKPKATDQVTFNYRGMLVDGKEFDSSFRNGKPLTVGVNQLIKGWSDALEMMPVGSKWELFIPADLAYGERGVQPVIGPNSTLIFELELLDIK